MSNRDASLGRRERAATHRNTAASDYARFRLVDERARPPEAGGSCAREAHSRQCLEPLRAVREACAALASWTVESLTAAFNEVIAKHELKLGKIAQPVRVAVTGGTASPGIFEVLEILGRDRTIARLDSALARIS